MAKKKELNLNLPGVDDLFTTQEERQEMEMEKVVMVPPDTILDFPNHPFKVRQDEEMQQLLESVKEHGILVPTLVRYNEDGNGLGGIQFTLDADNLDDLYSFSKSDRDGVDTSETDEDDDTSFSLTGYTRDSGRIAFRMTYKLVTADYYYYPDSQLEAMSTDDKKAAKKYLTDDLELDEGVDFASDMTKESAKKLMNQEMKDMKNDISNTYTLTEDNTGENKNIIVDPTFAKGVKITLKKADSWEKNADGEWEDSLAEVPSEYSKAYITGVNNKYKKATIDVVKKDSYSTDQKANWLCRGWHRIHQRRCGIYQPKKEMKKSTVPVALKKYLAEQSVTKIMVHYDNDFAGRKATETLKLILPDYEVLNYPPPRVEDYNDYLNMRRLQELKRKSRLGRLNR
jgi:hypothetical protein